MPFSARHDPTDPRQQIRQAHAELLIERLATLGEGERMLVELVAMADLPLRVDALVGLLRLAGLDPDWREQGQADLVRRLLRVQEFLIDPGGAELRAQGGLLLQRRAQLDLLESGRAARIAEALAGPQATALERLEPEYRSGLRLRLRIAGILAGLGPEALRLGTHRASQHDPVLDALERIQSHLRATDTALIDRLDPAFQLPVLETLLWRELAQPGGGQDGLITRAHALLARRPEAADRLARPLLDLAALRGEPMPALPIREGMLALGQCDALLARLRAGEPPQALGAAFDQLLRAWRSEHGRRALPPGLPGKLLLAVLTAAPDPALARRRELLARLRELPGEAEGGVGVAHWQAFMAARLAGRRFACPDPIEEGRPDDLWWLALLLHWAGTPWPSALREGLQALERRAADVGWHWLAAQCGALLRPDEDADPTRPPTLRDWLQPAPAWKIRLDALAQALAAEARARSPERSGASQLRIRLRPPRGFAEQLVFEVLEQRPRAGGFSAGRVLHGTALQAALDRIPPGDGPDRRLLQALLAEPGLDPRRGVPVASRTAAALVGHPRVFERGRETPIAVVAGELTLLTERRADGSLRLGLAPTEALEGEGAARLEDGVLHLYRPDSGLRRLAEILGEGLELPAEAAEDLRALLPDLAGKLRLQADLSQLGVQDLPADEQLIAQLEPFRDGLALRVVVRPLGPQGGVFAPGRGPAVVLSHGGGPLQRTRRDLRREREALATLVRDCEALQGLDDEARLEVEDPVAALELLEALQPLAPRLALEWRAGRGLRIARASGEAALRLVVESRNGWFATTGGLQLDDGSVVALSELLRALPSAQGRYLRLDEGRVLALGSALRRRLQLLHGLADEKGEVRVARAAAFALDAALDEDSERSADFLEQIERLRKARALDPPLPRGLLAELRDYQREGYRFLMRLAAAGLGACLADDMGLGKTVQALAVLLARATEGPALVVVPTSLIGNWQREAARFAPDLAVHRFGEGDRAETLAGLGPGDVLLASYGLLAGHAEALAQVEFATLVLDEAQAIKNPATARARAARRLRARFRMAATGTPLENHLGELWSLFRILNPGLLGSEEQFRRRFVAPLERDPRGPEREVLRRLIAPFLLRRTKAEVLAELPPRTEVVLEVEPGPEEARFMAALRRQALERLHGASAPLEQRRIHILAELTRLRRAACHPRLVAPELDLPSSKLEQLLELLGELLDNQHRALVFSQFTDYLALVRERLDREGIAYQYLDGSTPQRARDAAVRAFQQGSGDVFLLSLKAGGLGLNLTAADYVIHLDPWWNPAVEQQASDRAHRIGQTRPVTVYKLVLAGSIEERILDLHGSKRELADRLIGAGEGAAPVSVEELLELLGEP